MHASSQHAPEGDATSPEATRTGRIEQVRAFNRWYSMVLAAMNEQLANTEYSQTEVRVLFGLYNGGRVNPSALCSELRLDAGYLSRILRRFEREGMIERIRSDLDGRRHEVNLSGKGVTKTRLLYRRADDVIVTLLSDLDLDECGELAAAMETIRSILQRHGEPRPTGAR